jgi:salicylate hydroxylase
MTPPQLGDGRGQGETMPLRVAVVGAGLGGLAAAMFMRARGLSVDVYERDAAFRDVGAGIVVAPNMVRPLQRLGVAAGLEKFAVRLDHAWEFRGWRDGAVIASTPMREACDRLYGAPCYVAHRADLRAFLRAQLPEDVVHLDCRCTGVMQEADGVRLSFVGAGGRVRHTDADAVVAADGIHSTLRNAVTTQSPPRFSGLCAYRCLVPAERAPEMALRPAHILWLGPGRHFVHYPISSGRFVNVVAITPAGDWRSESWTENCEVAELMAEFAHWDSRVQRLIGSATQTTRWAIFDRAPLERWTAGRVALMGDAAHAMLPFLAQGAAQCVEDGETLAACLAGAEPEGVAAALQRYEALRRPRANEVLLGSRGREISNHLPDGAEQQARDARLAQSDPLQQIAWLYGETEAERTLFSAA